MYVPYDLKHVSFFSTGRLREGMAHVFLDCIKVWKITYCSLLWNKSEITRTDVILNLLIVFWFEKQYITLHAAGQINTQSKTSLIHNHKFV